MHLDRANQERKTLNFLGSIEHAKGLFHLQKISSC